MPQERGKAGLLSVRVDPRGGLQAKVHIGSIWAERGGLVLGNAMSPGILLDSRWIADSLIEGTHLASIRCIVSDGLAGNWITALPLTQPQKSNKLEVCVA